MRKIKVIIPTIGTLKEKGLPEEIYAKEFKSMLIERTLFQQIIRALFNWKK